MGMALTDLLLVAAGVGCAVYTAWVWPSRRVLGHAVGIGVLGCVLFTAIALALGDGVPGRDVLIGGFLAGFTASVRRDHTRSSPTP